METCQRDQNLSLVMSWLFEARFIWWEAFLDGGDWGRGLVLPLLNVPGLVDSKSCEHTQRYYELIYSRTVACLEASGISETCLPFSVSYNLSPPSSSLFLSSAWEEVINYHFIAEHTQPLTLDTSYWQNLLYLLTLLTVYYEPCSFHFFLIQISKWRHKRVNLFAQLWNVWDLQADYNFHLSNLS